MTFPKAPKKTVAGKLKLVARSPETEVVISDEAPIQKDLAGNIALKVPKGFSVDTTAGEVLTHQQKNAAEALHRIRNKLSGCGNCRNKVSELQVDVAEKILNFSCDFLVSKIENVYSIVVHQHKNGNIQLNFGGAKKQLHFLISSEGLVKAGFYADEFLRFEMNVVSLPDDLVGIFSWLIK